MDEKKMTSICAVLKTMIQRPILLQDIRIELLDVIRAKHLPKVIFPKHHHPWFEFNYFSEGFFVTEMCGTDFVCRKGQSLLIPPGVEHAQRSGPAGDDGICMRFQISAAQEEISERSLRLLEMIREPHPEALSVNIHILSDLGKGEFFNDSVLLHFILSVYEQWQDQAENPMPQRLISNQATLYMEEYLQHRILATDVARALNMSYRSLARIFKKETGVSIMEKLSELRINKACQLLSQTTLSVSKIAEETGFENVHYFSNAFRKSMRVSPTQFRAQQSEKGTFSP